MARKIKIVTEYDTFIHVDKGVNSYTLCGLETDGDSDLGLQQGQATNGKIDCPDCIDIIKICKTVKKSDMI